MLYILLADGRQFTWHVGKPKPMNPRKETCPQYPYGEKAPFDNVCEIQADGEELAHIFANFDYIPRRRGFETPNVWKNPFAQFIYDNL